MPTSRSPESTSAPMDSAAEVVQVAEGFLGAVGDVARDLLVADFVERASISYSWMWIEESTSSLTSRSEDRVLEVVALERHEGDEQVLAERESPSRVELPSQSVACRHLVAERHRGLPGG